MTGAATGHQGSAFTQPRWGLIRRVALFALIAGLSATVISQMLPRVYRAAVKILPSDTPVGLGLGDLLATSDLSALLGARGSGQNPALTYPEIIMSRPVLERTLDLMAPASPKHASRSVLAAIGIKGKMPADRYDRGVRKLRKLITVRPNPRSGIIDISVDTNDPELSAFVANGLVDNLNQFNLDVRESRSRAVRTFVEGRLHETAQTLAASEEALTQFRRSNMRVGNAPQLILEQERLQREVEAQSELYRLLQKQFEQARIEEQRDTPSFTVIEAAVPPMRRYKPSTILNAAGRPLTVVSFGSASNLARSFCRSISRKPKKESPPCRTPKRIVSFPAPWASRIRAPPRL